MVGAKVKLGLGLGLMSLLGTLFFFSPHLAVYNMRNAVKNNDADKLNGYVDYPALKESLKANFNAKMAKEMSAEPNNPFAAFGMMIGIGLVNNMVDSIVTPEGVANIMRGNAARLSGKSAAPSDSGNSGDTGAQLDMAYAGYGRFVVTMPTEKGNDPVKLIYVRHGLLDWKLSAVQLPL